MAQKHEPALDGLRALAIAGVVGFHYMPRVTTGGSLGVDIFFVLSGWLITSILIREVEKAGRVDYRGFLKRRFLRLTPPLFALLIAYVVLAPWLIPKAASWRWFDAGVTALYLTNLRETFWPRGNPLAHTWFLALQGQFYLAWPLILPAVFRLGRQKAAVALLGAWAVLTLARIVWFHTIGGPGPYYLTPLHATGLMLGSALALRPVKLPAGAGWVGLAALVLLLGFGQTKQHFLLGQPFAEWAALMVVAAPPRLLALPPLPFIGTISYGLYLWHVPFQWVVPATTWPNRIGLILVSILAGWLSWLLLERPFDKARKPRVQPQAAAS